MRPTEHFARDDKQSRPEPVSLDLGDVAEQDERDMRRMGKQREFKRNFKVLSISFFSVVTMMGWVFIPINIPNVIVVAGTGGCIVIYLANCFGFASTVLSLAEMSSIAPTAGGQYHWISEFAPPSMQKFLSYLSGWLSSLSWLVGVASGIFLAGNLIPSLIALKHPNFTPEPWQGYLFVVALCMIAFVVNGFFAKYLPLLESFIFGFTIFAFIGIVAALLILSPKLTGSEVFRTFPADLGSTGTLELLSSQVLVFYSLLGSDSTAHMAEETQLASVVIPRAMVWSYTFTCVLNFVVLLAVCFCWIDPRAYAKPASGYAFMELLITATGSTTGTVVITSVLIILVLMSFTNFMASTSRQVFAFARDHGLPFSRWIAKVNGRTLTPINSLIFVSGFVVLICLIGLGSSVAFNAIISLQAMAIAGTYQVSLVCLVWRRFRGRPLPPAAWSLGRWGLPLNIMGILYGWFLLFYAAIPGLYPVTPANMNWAPVMFGGVMIISLLYYLVWARRIYEGPVVHVVGD